MKTDVFANRRRDARIRANRDWEAIRREVQSKEHGNHGWVADMDFSVSILVHGDSAEDLGQYWEFDIFAHCQSVTVSHYHPIGDLDFSADNWEELADARYAEFGCVDQVDYAEKAWGIFKKFMPKISADIWICPVMADDLDYGEIDNPSIDQVNELEALYLAGQEFTVITAENFPQSGAPDA